MESMIQWYHAADPFLFLIAFLVAMIISMVVFRNGIDLWSVILSAIILSGCLFSSYSITVLDKERLEPLKQKVSQWSNESEGAPLYPRAELKKLIEVFSEEPEAGFFSGFGQYNRVLNSTEEKFFRVNSFLSSDQFTILEQFFERCYLPMNPLILDTKFVGYPVTRDEAGKAIEYAQARTPGSNAECFSSATTLSFLTKNGGILHL